MAIYREPVRPDFWQLSKYTGDGYVDPWAPLDCATHSAARAIERQFEGVKPAGITGLWPPTGGWIRQVTANPDGSLDRSGGVNHSQMAAVASKYYGFALDVRNGMSWDALIAEIAKTRGAMISVRYRLISLSAYSGEAGFTGNHELFCESVDLGARTMRIIDPLADGRYAGIYHGPGDYPMELIKRAAGELVLDSAGRQLGYGLVYAALTQATGDAPQVNLYSLDVHGYAPLTWYVRAGQTLSAYSPTHPGSPVKTITFPHASSAHADADVWINWSISPAPIPRGGPFLRVIDGSFGPALNNGVQLYIVKAQVAT